MNSNFERVWSNLDGSQQVRVRIYKSFGFVTYYFADGSEHTCGNDDCPTVNERVTAEFVHKS